MLGIGRALNGAREDDPYGRAVDGFIAGRALADRKGRRQAGGQQPSDQPSGSACSRRPTAISHRHDRQMDLRTCAQAIGAPELSPIRTGAFQEPRRAQRRNQQARREEIDRALVNELNAAGMPCGPIFSIDQMFEDAQVRASWHRPGLQTRAGWQRGRLSSANRPARCSPGSASVRKRSPN